MALLFAENAPKMDEIGLAILCVTQQGIFGGFHLLSDKKRTLFCSATLHQLPLMKQNGATWSAVVSRHAGVGHFPGTVFELGSFTMNLIKISYADSFCKTAKCFYCKYLYLNKDLQLKMFYENVA